MDAEDATVEHDGFQVSEAPKRIIDPDSIIYSFVFVVLGIKPKLSHLQSKLFYH